LTKFSRQQNKHQSILPGVDPKSAGSVRSRSKLSWFRPESIQNQSVQFGVNPKPAGSLRRIFKEYTYGEI